MEVTLDDDDKRYLDHKFGDVYSKVNDLTQRVAKVETSLQDGDGPIRRREFVLAMQNSQERIERVDESLNGLTNKLWAIVFLVLAAVVSVWLTSVLRSPSEEVRELREELSTRHKEEE